ncbi:GDSL esterase/lipase At3g14820-like [Dioscorea cayenensis subsp. rotundata]|uniref:GDSL esterase/lipase At3g14820-like n=1 Tax=Dioscorea cayennensis subsp. rotundata TaxID=55577 RepID=A0AB40AL26_DIOCR|nr:GDSL esterase/lipase At3g14820-like [Dioscorea cayenensis subsp. rotundata]
MKCIASLLLALIHLANLLNSATTQNAPVVPAVIVFGDSIVDPGNNNNLKTPAKANYPPYGQDFPGHFPSGRFSNGKIPGDFLVSGLGIKEYLPPFVGVELEPNDIITGVSLASSGSGYDTLTDSISGVFSVEEQLKFFDEYKEKLRGVAGDEKADSIISEALYIVCTGTVDFALTYFSTPFRSKHYDIPSYVELLVSSASTFLKELSLKGARKIGFVGLPPIGCVPSQRTAAGGLSRECVPVRNEAASLFNSRISEEIDSLQMGMLINGTRIIFIDIYPLLLDIIQRPHVYGFEEATKGCCGTGTIEVSFLCNSLTKTTCDDPSKFVFWDTFHPTERAYKILTDEIFENYLPYLQ